MTIHLPKWLVGDDPKPEPSRLDILDARVAPVTWWARCDSPHSTKTEIGPFADPELAFEAIEWNPNCDVLIFSKGTK